MKQISVNDLVNKLMTIEPNTEATIKTLTDPKLKKTNNPYEGVLKESVSQVTLNYRYSDEVNRQRAREGAEFDFTPKPRKWGTRLGETALITHNSQIYVSACFRSVDSTKYLHEGNEIDKTLLEQWIPVRKSQADKQGLATEVIVRDFKLNSLVSIQIEGEEEMEVI